MKVLVVYRDEEGLSDFLRDNPLEVFEDVHFRSVEQSLSSLKGLEYNAVIVTCRPRHFGEEVFIMDATEGIYSK